MIYLRETIWNGVVLYRANESHTLGTIFYIAKQNTTPNKKKLLHLDDTLTPDPSDREFQNEEEALCWACLNEI